MVAAGGAVLGRDSLLVLEALLQGLVDHCIAFILSSKIRDCSVPALALTVALLPRCNASLVDVADSTMVGDLWSVALSVPAFAGWLHRSCR